MASVTASLRTMRFFDRLIIKGKRMMLSTDHTDPCDYGGPEYEEVLAFLATYVNDKEVREDYFVWTALSIDHLEHIAGCPHCLTRVFSVPDRELAIAVHEVLVQVG